MATINPLVYDTDGTAREIKTDGSETLPAAILPGGSASDAMALALLMGF